MTGPLRERTDALAMLAAETGRTKSGRGRLVLLRGATGTGRTALLEAAAQYAAGQGLRVLRARCSPDGTSGPLATVRRLLASGTGRPREAHRPPAAQIPSPHGDSAGVLTCDQASGPGRAVRPDAQLLWEELCGYAADGPLLLAVDDAHLADDESRAWLAETARRIDDLPVLVVATERSQFDVEQRPAGLAHALPPDLLRTHSLAPLSDAAATALVRDARPDADEQWTASVVRAGARNPLLLHALLEDLADVPPSAVPESCAALYPGTFRAAVSWWLESAGPDTARVARTLATLERAPDGPQDPARPDARPQDPTRPDAWPQDPTRPDARPQDPTRPDALPQDPSRPDPLGPDAEPPRAREPSAPGPEVLAGAARADASRTSGWLAAMTGLGLLVGAGPGRPARYPHPLLRDAVLSGWPVARRQEAHRAAAETMLQRGESAEPVARQLLHVDPAGAPWVPTVLRDAATAALGGGRADDAVRYLRRALREPLPDGHRQRVLTELGSLEYATAAAADGVPHLAEALHLPVAPQERAHTAIALGTALFGRGESGAGAEVLRSVAGQLAGHPEPARAARAAYVLLSDRNLTMRREAYEWLADTAEHSPETVGAAGRALLLRHAATAGACSARQATRRIRALLAEPADPLSEPFLFGTVAAVAQWADELDEADRLVDRGLVGLRPSLLHPTHHALHNTRIDIAAARGSYGRLLAVSRTRPAALRGRGPANIDAHALVALVETGRTQEAQHFAESFDLGGAADSWELNRFLYARGLHRAARGEHSAALHDFLECGRRQSTRGVVSPVVTPWRTAAAECQLRLGARHHAVALAEEELRLAGVWRTPRTTGRALRVLGLAVGGARGRELLGEAVDVLRGSPAHTELVEALLARGRELVAAGGAAEGDTLLREAAARAGRLGAVRLRLRAERALESAGYRPATRSGALTPGEERVARLAADGRTNAEIAGLLRVALRTVETHLTHTYRKLGIRRRTGLGKALDALDAQVRE
ncbi:AAA family ATPase [Streptomyces sp. NPDC091272]|uniref:AAA family ATPase n=1 Tax=Streptomyces sp. NPDC091272 TaxID=3365981 RepID=UPI0037F7D7CA